jgi:S-adenosylmethionine:tRNA ribosyltransferase-isomerase
MQLKDLDFQYPETLVATERAPNSRVMWVENGKPAEISLSQLIEKFQPGDVLVINDTKVLKRRVFSEAGLEILFLKPISVLEWEVLCPSSRWKQNTKQILPEGFELELTARGKPQTVKSNRPLTEDFFQKYGELPLPPYIQKARNERHNTELDSNQYQTAWAEQPGSLAAPTASLHFTSSHLRELDERGIEIVRLTLHVGLGTFLPIVTENLDEHIMHAEQVEISSGTWQAVQNAKLAGTRVWALGTTVARSLESAALGILPTDPRSPGGYFGETSLFIRPGFAYRVVDCLLTNFHQPQSTLLALVGAFAGLQNVKDAYQWAIEKKFRLFSYGDLTAWIKG